MRRGGMAVPSCHTLTCPVVPNIHLPSLLEAFNVLR
jgi:hypothetical protein